MNIYDDICVTPGNYGSLRPLNRMALTKETNIDEPLNNTWSYPHQQHTALPQPFYMNSAITSECTLFIWIYPSQNFKKKSMMCIKIDIKMRFIWLKFWYTVFWCQWMAYETWQHSNLSLFDPLHWYGNIHVHSCYNHWSVL